MKQYFKEVLELPDSFRVLAIVGLAIMVLLLSIICIATDVATQADAKQTGDSHLSTDMMGMKM